MVKRLFFMTIALCMLTCSVIAQNLTASGVVISVEDGEPIIGATVRVLGSTTGTITDFDGNFVIEAPEGSSLQFSYVGMITETHKAAKNMHVKMRTDSKNLDEVVVTAMGISKEKKALGYAVQDIKADELSKGANTTLAGALQGKLSGVEITPSSGMPGASSRINIRGSRSFTGDNSPLYVIDGMPIASTPDMSTGNSVTGSDYANRALDLDPNDIESINVLKGQAASALYGLRASNGVIIITTKSGKGASKGKPSVSINTSLSFEKPTTLPDYQKTYAQGWSESAFSPTASVSWGPKISELANDKVYGGNVDNAYTQQYGLQPGKYYVPQRAAAGLDPWATPQAYDNIKDFFQTGHTWSTSVNVAQSFDRGNFSISLGNTNQDGIVGSTGLDRYNAKIGAEGKLHNNWDAGFVGNFVSSKVSKQTSANNGIVATVYGAPSSYDLKGIPSHVLDDPYTQNNYRNTSGFDNAYWALDNNKFTEKNNRFFGNVFTKYSTKFNTTNHKLDVKYQLGTDSYTTKYSDLWGFGHTDKKGSITHTSYSILDFNSLLTASYYWTINDKWTFDAIYGNEFIDSKTDVVEAYGAEFNSSGWNHINNTSTRNASESYSKRRTVGNFVSASLAFNNMLYLNATGRADRVSSMPRGNRTFFYPSVSLGWIFTELEPLKNDILTYGKIRTSYAEVGQAGVYLDSYYSTPTYGGGFYSGTPIQYPIDGIVGYTKYGRIYDPNLKPQNTKSYELGVDLSFLNDRFSVNYTYSRQNVKDQIFDIPLAASTGSSVYRTNGGKLHTDAHELSIGVTPIRNRNFQWDVNFNFSKTVSMVDELATGVNSIMLGGFVDPQVRAGIGYAYPVIYGSSFLRNENGDIVVDADGLPQYGGEDMVLGQITPKFMLGINTSFQIYKLSVSATLDWKNGGKMYHGSFNTMGFYGTTQESADRRQSNGFLFDLPAVKQNADGTYSKNDILISPELAYDYYDIMSGVSEGGVQDAGYLKFREITLSYPVWSGKGVEVNLSAFARNILVWSQLKGGFDPEASQGNTNMGGGFERFSLPTTSSYGFGLNVKF